MLFTAASCGFPAIDGFLVFHRVGVRVKVRLRVSARVREALSCGTCDQEVVGSIPGRVAIK